VRVERLAENISAYVGEHPDDPQGYYLLGRVHGLAYAMKTDYIASGGAREGLPQPKDSKLPAVLDDQQQQELLHGVALPPGKEPDDKAAWIKHLDEAVGNLMKANSLDGKQCHYALNLAYALDAGVRHATSVRTLPSHVPPPPQPDKDSVRAYENLITRLGAEEEEARNAANHRLLASLEDAAQVLHKHREHADDQTRAGVASLLKLYWKGQARDWYLEAYRMSIEESLKHEYIPLFGLRTLVAYEAGHAYLRLVEEIGPGAEPAAVKEEVEANMATFKRRPRGGVTPIILSFDKSDGLDDLLATNKAVDFDLDGDGRVESWPWIKPDTALLVWDPNGTGVIESGRQLFGSVTWWMFFEDGYQAMNALDDNRDGELAGEELAGLALWFDRNGNGVSDTGEVIPIERTPVEALTTFSLSRDGDSPWHPAGMRLKDGRTLATYDWVTSSVDGPSVP
jgi:hypothetical protein